MTADLNKQICSRDVRSSQVRWWISQCSWNTHRVY